MKIPVHRLLHIGDEKLHLDKCLDLGQLVGRHHQLVAVQPVSFTGQMYKEAGLIVLTGELQGSYTLQCSRCLEPFTQSFKLPVLERFDLSPSFRDYALEQEEDGDIHPVRGQMVDLLPYFEEHVLLSIPFVPSCSDEAACRTRMTRQGKDWVYHDQAEQREQKSQPDPRLAKLARFFDKEEA